MTNKIVPFGKYKGQPVEVLANDPQYCDWLAGEAWFRERHADLYKIVVINNFAEPEETPEHNALQVLFLDWNFCRAFCNRYKEMADDQVVGNIKFEDRGWDAVIHIYQKYQEDETEWSSDKQAYVKTGKKLDRTRDSYQLYVEIKPSVGDDYPAILRQMSRPLIFKMDRGTREWHPENKVLFVDKYNGVGATREQFVQTFLRSRIKVIFKDEMPL